jgi:hypothetical protein
MLLVMTIIIILQSHSTAMQLYGMSYAVINPNIIVLLNSYKSIIFLYRFCALSIQKKHDFIYL